MGWLANEFRAHYFIAGLVTGASLIGGVAFWNGAAYGQETDVTPPTVTPTPVPTSQPSQSVDLPDVTPTETPGGGVDASTGLPTAGTGGFVTEDLPQANRAALAAAAGLVATALAVLRSVHRSGPAMASQRRSSRQARR